MDRFCFWCEKQRSCQVMEYNRSPIEYNITCHKLTSLVTVESIPQLIWPYSPSSSSRKTSGSSRNNNVPNKKTNWMNASSIFKFSVSEDYNQVISKKLMSPGGSSR